MEISEVIGLILFVINVIEKEESFKGEFARLITNLIKTLEIIKKSSPQRASLCMEDLIEQERVKTEARAAVYGSREGKVLILYYAIFAHIIGMKPSRNAVEDAKDDPPKEWPVFWQLYDTIYMLTYEWLLPIDSFRTIADIHNRQATWFYRGYYSDIFWILYDDRAIRRMPLSRKKLQKYLDGQKRLWAAEQEAKPAREFGALENIQVEGWRLLRTWQDYKEAGDAMNNCIFWNMWGNDQEDPIFWNKEANIAVSTADRENRFGPKNRPLTAEELQLVKLLKKQVRSAGETWDENWDEEDE